MNKLNSTKDLKLKANEIRRDIIETLRDSKSGHAGGAMGLADIFSVLYFHEMNYESSNPNWEERDRLVVSNGHVNPVWYVTLAHAGFIKKDELKTLRKINSKLQGHPSRLDTPGIENSSGPLGQGLSQAIGMALSFKMDNKSNQVFCICSDGEHNEGQTWEAILFAGNKEIANLTVILDRNRIQIDGFTEDVMPLDSLKDKYLSFKWNVIEINGNSVEEIINSIKEARSNNTKPTVIIANTVPGKGVSFMENRYEWHGKSPNEEEAKLALDELEEEKRNIELIN